MGHLYKENRLRDELKGSLAGGILFFLRMLAVLFILFVVLFVMMLIGQSRMVPEAGANVSNHKLEKL